VKIKALKDSESKKLLSVKNVLAVTKYWHSQITKNQNVSQLFKQFQISQELHLFHRKWLKF